MKAIAADSRHSGPDQRSGHHQPAGAASTSTATRPPRSRSTPTTIESAFYDAYGPQWVSTIYAAINEYKVLLELEPQFQADPHSLSLLYFKSTSGPVGAAGDAGDDHAGGRPAVDQPLRAAAGRHAFASTSRRATRSATWSSRCDAIADETCRPTVTFSFQGAAKAFESSLANLALLLVVAILVVYIVLGILYESYIHPITILSGLPSAGFGALVTLYLFHMDLNIYAFVGLIMLIGIVEKNAIMQIDFALDAERNQGMPPLKAIYEGCLIRFRPIMMTTMAALLGAVPIALGYGAGGEARQPLGLVVVGGLIFSQLVTLYLTPVFYTYMASLQEKLGRKKRKPAPAQTPVHTPA